MDMSQGVGQISKGIFQTEAINKYVTDALATVPEGDQVATVVYVDADKTLRGVVAVRAGDNWTFAAHVEKPKGDPLEFGAAVRFSF